MSLSPAPLPGLGSGLAVPTCVSRPGVDWLYLLDHAKPENGRVCGSSLPVAAFQVGVNAAGCFPAGEVSCSWGPLQ